MTRIALVLATLFPVAAGFATGCDAGASLPANDSYAQRYVGSWRATASNDATSFSDYVFQGGGTLTTLRSVIEGNTVAPMQGAGLVHNTKTGVSCAFGTDWYSADASTVLVGGECTDGIARDITLDFGNGTTALSQVTVRAVAGEVSWMEPVGWSFRRCDLHACD
ncbi:MAG: hypothetical protein ABI321_00560 [Polyangia bacterium]